MHIQIEKYSCLHKRCRQFFRLLNFLVKEKFMANVLTRKRGKVFEYQFEIAPKMEKESG